MFTPRVCKVLSIAKDEAAKVGTDAIGTDDLLLAIALEPNGIGYAVLERLHVDAESIRSARMFLRGKEDIVYRPEREGKTMKGRGTLFIVSTVGKKRKTAKRRRKK